MRASGNPGLPWVCLTRYDADPGREGLFIVSRSPLLCLVHVPKTGGTALLGTLNAILGRDKVYWIAHDHPRSDWENSSSEDFDRYSVVGGHAEAPHFDKIRRPKIFLAILREPVERAVSLFSYILTGPDDHHPLRETLRGLSIMEALERCAEFRRQVENFQCTMIGGAPTLSSAVQSLYARDWFIGPLAQLDEIFERVCAEYGWPFARPIRDNVGTPGYPDRYVSEEARAFLSSLNREDHLLYEKLSVALRTKDGRVSAIVQH
jgi:hypothetical protein